jgi:hypothetical protein
VHLTTGPEDPKNLTPEGYDLSFMTNVTGRFPRPEPLLRASHTIRAFLPYSALTACADDHRQSVEVDYVQRRSEDY